MIGALVALAVSVVGGAFYLGRELGKLRTEVEKLRVEFRDHTRAEISTHEGRYHAPTSLRAVADKD